jgi:hypothetical protein
VAPPASIDAGDSGIRVPYGTRVPFIGKVSPLADRQLCLEYARRGRRFFCVNRFHGLAAHSTIEGAPRRSFRCEPEKGKHDMTKFRIDGVALLCAICGCSSGAGGIPTSGAGGMAASATTGSSSVSGASGGSSGASVGNASTGSSGAGATTATSAAGSGGNAGSSVSTGSSAGTGSSASAGSGGSTNAFINPKPGGELFVGTNFWNPDWQPSADYFTVTPGKAFTGDNPWQPQFLADLAPYSVLRFMDFNLTNTSASNDDAGSPHINWNWDTRPLKGDANALHSPVALEWQIDLCNRTHKDYWINVPHHASTNASPSDPSDYWSKLATLIHDQLDPNLRVYVEWSNEVWNSGFGQSGYATSQAHSVLGIYGYNDQDSTHPATPGYVSASSAYYVYSAVRMFEAFEAVFGKGSPQLVKVLSGFAEGGNPQGVNTCGDHKTALADHKQINPNQTMPDVYTIAPYVDATVSGTSATDDLSGPTTQVSDHLACLAGIGVPLITYEGGVHESGCNPSATDLQHLAAFHDVVSHYLDALKTAGLKGPYIQYTHSGECWGLKQSTTDSATNAPGYKGLVDWVAANPAN